jgi:hypothetical protein
LVIPGDGLKLG